MTKPIMSNASTCLLNDNHRRIAAGSGICEYRHTIFAALAGILFSVLTSLGSACVLPTENQVQPQQIYVKKDDSYFYWMIIYAAPLPVGVMCAENVAGGIVGQTFDLLNMPGTTSSMGGRVHLNAYGTYSTRIFTPTYQPDDPASISGRILIGQLSLAKMAQDGITFPADISTLQYAAYFYLGNGLASTVVAPVGPNNSPPNQTYSLSSLTNEWQQVYGSLAALPTHTLAVARSGSGSGTITSSPAGISCGTDCWEDFSSGSTVTLTATPAAGSYFHGWSGACAGSVSCVVSMNAAREVTAIFKPTPFVATTTSNITATSATISTTVSFNAADVGKSGSVFATAWAPVNGLSALGIATAQSKGLSVTTTRNNPYSGGKVITRMESLATVMAADDASSAFVLVQLTPSGWQLVSNGQLVPYASGVLGDSMASLSILNNANPASIGGTQFCVGYGTSAAEMVAAGRMIPVADITSAVPATNGSCNVAVNPYKGLWYNASESGWGMSVTQHDNINFVALYTYNQSAQPVWYVMSNCPIVTAGSCSGEIYRVTGGSVPTSPWAPNLGVTAVGSGTLTFSDTRHGKFDFTLNGVAGSKTIQRQEFASGTLAQAVDYSDLWWNADESGWGVSLTQDMGMIFAAWYTYDASGNAVWYVASSCPLSGSSCSGELYRVTGGSAPTSPWAPNLSVTPVGSVSFAFSDSGSGTMTYTINGASGTKTITRQLF